MNNPLRMIDPTGLTVTFAGKADEKTFNDLYAASDQATQGRYDELKKSDVEYRIDMNGTTPSGVNGQTLYNFTSGRIDVLVKSGLSNPIGTLGDELRTAHQFETGKIGYMPGGATLGYDMWDEAESKMAGVDATNAYNAAYGTNYALEPQIQQFLTAAQQGNAGLTSYFSGTNYNFHPQGYNFPISANFGMNGRPGLTASQLDQHVQARALTGYAFRALDPGTGTYKTYRNP